MAFPSDLVRTKDWGTETLFDADLEGQLDVIIQYINDLLNPTTGHRHTGGTNQGAKLDLTQSVKIAGGTRGSILYVDATTGLKALGPGTSGQFLKTQGANNDPIWADTGASSGGNVRGGYRNLKITRPSVSTVTITADELVLQDASNNAVTVQSVNETPNITVAGVNGLDTGAEASSTWYFLWIIRKSADGTVDSLLSTSSSAPTLPAGYDQKALISAVRNDGSSNFINFTQEGRKYNYQTWQTLASGNVGEAGWTSIDTSALVPAALSTHIYGASRYDTTVVQVTNDNTVTVASATDAAGKYTMRAPGANEIHSWQLPILTANTIYWTDDTVNGAVRLIGFDINKLS